VEVYFFGFIAGLIAVFLEYRYATYASFWSWDVLPYTALSLIIPYCVFRMVKASPNLIVALVVFSFSTVFLRVIVTLTIQRQQVTPGTWAALGLLLLSQFARRW
jgi:hypothetical protein